MKKLILIFSLAIIALIRSNAQNLDFIYVYGLEELDSTLEQNRHANKMFMLSFSSSACEPCQDVENFTYTDQYVIECLQENLVLIKVDVDNHANYPLISKYQADRIPYFVFLNNIGNEIGYEAGNLIAQDMIEVCRDYTLLYQNLFDIEEAYENSPDDILTVAAYALILEEMAYYEKGFEIAERYHSLYDTLRFTEEEWQILNLYGPGASIDKTRQVIKNHDKIRKEKNQEELNYFLIDAFQYFYDLAIENRSQEQLREALQVIPLVDYGGETTVPYTQMQEYFVLRYYQEIGDWKNYSEYAVYFIGKYPMEDADIAEVIYNFYYYIEKVDLIELAGSWAAALIRKEENFSNLIAYAMMQYRLGDEDRANKYLDKATKLAVTNDEKQIIFKLSQEFNKGSDDN